MRLIAPSKVETGLMEPFEMLPIEAIRLPTDSETFELARREIEAAGVAGFDTESKPTFRVGEKSGGPHVVQFALPTKAFIFQLHRPGSEHVVSDLLQSERVRKVGFGLKNDRGHIQSRLGVPLRALLDLDHVFRRLGYTGQIGVRAAVGAVLGQNFPKSKRITTSNWAAEELTSRQLLYAANDAYAALRVMEALELDRENRMPTDGAAGRETSGSL